MLKCSSQEHRILQNVENIYCNMQATSSGVTRVTSYSKKGGFLDGFLIPNSPIDLDYKAGHIVCMLE